MHHTRSRLLARAFCVFTALVAGAATPALAQTDYVFGLIRGDFKVIGFFGNPNFIVASGPATVRVTFETAEGAADDDDGDMRDEVQIELVSMELTGDSDFGPVPVSLWAGAPSLGEIEERTNSTPGTLDLPPFTGAGDADSFINLHLQTTVFGITVHNVTPAPITAIISEWPPPAGEIYSGTYDPRIPLVDDTGFAWGQLEIAELEFLPTGDWGDAPDPFAATAGEYPTLKEWNGAAHNGDGTLRLGTLWDRELDGQPNADASGEGADDDGVVFTSPLELGVLPTDASVEVTASQPGVLDAWVDFNLDGDWADAGEKVFDDVGVVAGSNALTFQVPTSAMLGCTYARFRLSTAGGLSFDGIAADGEVEDYQVGIVPVPDIDLFNQNLGGAQTFVASNSITAGGAFAFFPDLVILGGAQIVFHAENQVILKHGLQVDNDGELTILVGSAPTGGCPP